MPISWSALLLSLTAATGLSVLAFLKPRAAFIWYAAATLGIALMAAASISAPAEFGLAPLVTVLGFTVGRVRRQPGRRDGARPRDGHQRRRPACTAASS